MVDHTFRKTELKHVGTYLIYPVYRHILIYVPARHDNNNVGGVVVHVGVGVVRVVGVQAHSIEVIVVVVDVVVYVDNEGDHCSHEVDEVESV